MPTCTIRLYRFEPQSAWRTQRGSVCAVGYIWFGVQGTVSPNGVGRRDPADRPYAHYASVDNKKGSRPCEPCVLHAGWNYGATQLTAAAPALAVTSTIWPSGEAT